MAEHFVSALASPAAEGTVADPWLFEEMIASVNGGGVGNGDTVWIKADGEYQISAQSITIDGGNTAAKQLVGYSVTPGDGGMAAIKRTSGDAIFLNGLRNYWIWENFVIDGNAGGSEVLRLHGNSLGINIEAKNGAAIGFQIGKYFNCYSHNNGTQGFVGGEVVNCLSVSNGDDGFQGCDWAINCISDRNGGDGFLTAAPFVIANCIANENDDNAFWLQRGFMVNSIARSAPSGKYGIALNLGSSGRAFNTDTFGCIQDEQVASLSTNTVDKDPEFRSIPSSDFTRTGSNVDYLGYSTVGMKTAVRYKVDIGMDQSGGDYPVEGNVRSQISYRGADYTGNLGLPTAEEVKTGVAYGSNSSELTGSYAPAPKSIKALVKEKIRTKIL